MSKIKLNFTEWDMETDEEFQEEIAYSCEVSKNIIKYVDENKTSHEIIFSENDLRINSDGDYEVTNHYVANANTELNLNIKKENISYMLGIDTSILEINETCDKINIELKYKLFEDSGVISRHHILIEVTK